MPHCARSGVAMAVATDCNPGTSPATSLLLMLNMACTLFRLTPEEALAGATVHAARALGLTDRGTLAVGQRADIAAWNIAEPAELSYRIGGESMRRRGSRRPRRAVGRLMELWTLHRGGQPARHRRSARRHARSRCASAAAYRGGTNGSGHGLARRKTLRVCCAEGATLFCATHSRYVVDLNRDPSGAALYAGADNTELCPTRTFGGEAIYRDGSAPAQTEVAERIAAKFTPYHAALTSEIGRVRDRHGYAIVLDGHSIRGVVPRFFEGRLPDLNLGTASGASCAPELEASAARVLAGAEGFTHVVNGRFKGGWITRHYGRPQEGVHALQLEIAQDCYMDEAPPYRWDPGRAERLGHVLRRLVHELTSFRPIS